MYFQNQEYWTSINIGHSNKYQKDIDSLMGFFFANILLIGRISYIVIGWSSGVTILKNGGQLAEMETILMGLLETIAR